MRILDVFSSQTTSPYRFLLLQHRTSVFKFFAFIYMDS